MSETKYPPYVNQKLSFKHDRVDIRLKLLSNWHEVDALMNFRTDVCAIYFPPSVEIQFDKEIEARLVHDLRLWPFFDSFSPSLAQLGIDWSRFCSAYSHLSYERILLLHHHLAWIFIMDEVTEKLPIYNLHSTVGKVYLKNLKNIIRDGPIEDMTQFNGSCPDELIRSALHAQRILAEDLMPRKKNLLSPHHLRACIDTLDLYFEYQYEEGHKFCAEQTSQEILKTRSNTIGALMPMLLSMTSAQAEIYRPDDPCLIQISTFIAIFNDMIGLYKDLDSLEARDDGSVYLNLVRAAMREHGLSEEGSLRFYAHKLNQFSQCYEFFLDTYPPLRQQFYHDMLRFCYNMYDYHLIGILGKTNNRYGWKQVLS